VAVNRLFVLWFPSLDFEWVLLSQEDPEF